MRCGNGNSWNRIWCLTFWLPGRILNEFSCKSTYICSKEVGANFFLTLKAPKQLTPFPFLLGPQPQEPDLISPQ